MVLIDVRGGTEFEKVRIPGSINIPAHAIKTKTFLKSKPLILLNEGYSCSRLEDECRRLRESGFEVAILDGGLNRWREKGNPLDGDPFARTNLNKVPPQAFFEERHYDNWIVIDAAESKKPEAKRLIPESIPLQRSGDMEGAMAEFKKICSQYKKKPFLSVLVVDDDGKQYERMEKLIQKTGISNVFYLQGGIEGYQAFLLRQAALLQAKQHPKKTVNKCASCP